MELKNKYATQFNQDMEKEIKKWQKEEEEFYNTEAVPAFNKDPFLSPFIGTLKTFPHNLYLIWMWGPYAKQEQIDLDLNKLNKISDKIQMNYKGNSSVEKGKNFEDWLARLLTTEVGKHVANAFSKKLEHVGQKNKREDFLINDIYSIDAKYSDLTTEEKFKNIIKPWGNDYYSNVQAIELGILRSMYREGAQQGRFYPKATGRTKHHGILKYDKTDGWIEVSQEDYTNAGFGNIPSLRKNLLYIFNDDGYWASHCLQEVTKWAANKMEDLGFENVGRGKKGTTINPYEFWGFTENEWNNRKPWYGVRK